MFEPQHLVDLQDNRSATAAAGTAEPNSWLSGDVRLHHTASSSPSSLHRTLSALSNASAAGSYDPVLFNDLVEMVPLVQSLIVSNFLVFYSCLKFKSVFFFFFAN